MFLPVLLVREMGVWGWIVFAVPNVIGAAAMGWVLRSRDSSEKITSTHSAACNAFSIVTIAFHVFFTLWFIPRLVGLPTSAVVFALTAIYLLATMTQSRSDLASAALVWTVSLGLLALWLARAPGPLIEVRSAPTIGALWLAPVCVLGFLLCPYLDLTFHCARQSLDSGARSAFGIGFGVVFFLMILFTLLYTRLLVPIIGPDWRQHTVPHVLALCIGVHMLVQTAFTLALHGRAVATGRGRGGTLLAQILFLQLALVLGLGANVLPPYHGMDAGEMIYRLFMAFYGLVFPAYVWVCMVPGRETPTAKPTPAKLRAMCLAIVVAAPMYWLGFIEGRMAWLAPGVMVVLASRYLAIEPRPRTHQVGGRP